MSEEDAVQLEEKISKLALNVVESVLKGKNMYSFKHFRTKSRSFLLSNNLDLKQIRGKYAEHMNWRKNIKQVLIFF